ncbi:unnamed protein product [Ectocarpus sp. 4 AP-2014]
MDGLVEAPGAAGTTQSCFVCLLVKCTSACQLQRGMVSPLRGSVSSNGLMCVYHSNIATTLSFYPSPPCFGTFCSPKLSGPFFERSSKLTLRDCRVGFVHTLP